MAVRFYGLNSFAYIANINMDSDPRRPSRESLRPAVDTASSDAQVLLRLVRISLNHFTPFVEERGAVASMTGLETHNSTDTTSSSRMSE